MPLPPNNLIPDWDDAECWGQCGSREFHTNHGFFRIDLFKRVGSVANQHMARYYERQEDRAWEAIEAGSLNPDQNDEAAWEEAYRNLRLEVELVRRARMTKPA